MKYNLRIEDLASSLNDWYRGKFPNSTGNFVIKKNIEKGMFAAIKTFTAEVIHVDVPNKIKNSILTASVSEKTLNEDDETKAWNKVGVLLNTELFKFIMTVNWEEDYGDRD